MKHGNTNRDGTQVKYLLSVKNRFGHSLIDSLSYDSYEGVLRDCKELMRTCPQDMDFIVLRREFVKRKEDE